MKFSWNHFFLVALLGTVASAQVSVGTPPFASFGGGPFDAVNLGNLNVHFAIPVLHKAGRGLPFAYDLSYDGSIWAPKTSNGTTQWQPDSNWGWKGTSEAAVGYVSQTATQTLCRYFQNNRWQQYYYTVWNTYGYGDKWGVFHPAYIYTDNDSQQNCGIDQLSGSATTNDGSGYTISVLLGFSATVTSVSGQTMKVPITRNNPTTSGTVTDANGNQITQNTSGQIFDTLSSTTPVLTISSPAPPSSTTFTYVAPSGANAVYTMNYLQYTVKTNFGVSNASGLIVEYGPITNSLVSTITLPDDSPSNPDRYTFAYEQTPGSCTPNQGTQPSCVTGRIQSIILPTGGTITYTYSGGANGTGIFSDGSTAGLTRQLNPGGEWQYTRVLQSGSVGPGSTWTTTVIDPNSNNTVINSAEDGNTAHPTYNFYETQRQVYQGSVSPSNLLTTSIRCYNAHYASCSTATVSSPFSQADVYTQLPNTSTRLSEVLYSGYGLVTDEKEYGYGVTLGSAPSSTYLVRETAATYASLSNNIFDRPASVTVKDWSSHSAVTLAYSTFTYDGTTPTATTGTPQHISITGSRGNLTTIGTQANSSGTTLYRKLTYYDTGNVNTTTDSGTTTSGGPNITTFNYNNTGTPSPSCGNSFVTSVSEPLGLSSSTTWNCVGGVALQTTDENGRTLKTDYTDAHFWRPADVYDQLNYETTVSYISSTAVERALSFNNGSSISDIRTMLDGFGRPTLSQRAQAPSLNNYDSTETDYDSTGQAQRITMPFQAAAGVTSSTAPATTMTHDALGRPETVTDGGGGTVGYTYTNNDTLQTIGPAPTRENTKQKQFEYDGLGRLASVCEVTAGTSAWPGGNCAQGNLLTGYWTQYTYDAVGKLTKVVQNAQAATNKQQGRIFLYDMLSRKTSETNPETGTTQYFYDTLTSDAACGNVSYPGRLVKKLDAVGNSICYSYDALHRLTSVTYPSGSYSSVTPTKRFVYDATTENGYTLNNTKGRMAEAYTCTGSCSSKITDDIFSYSPRGEMTDVYQSTPHSGGYYHTSASYWANGALDTLGGIPSVPTIYYGASDGTGLDGEGRITKVNASSGTNPVTAATYVTSGTTEPIGALTLVTLGSTDNDSFTYNANTGRITTYSFAVNSQTDTGTLTWNQNGTLGKLVIANQFNAADSQTCTYAHDDLSRLGGTDANGYSVDCGSTWQQLFAFDPFGNITKSGSSSFLPTYSTTTNQFTISGVTVAYDANGNLTTDNLNFTYTWDADNHPVTVNSVGVTYDALGRMAEKNVSGAYTEYVYSPTGDKVASASGQALVKASVSLPGGAKAIYTSSSIAYYRHSDWLGSSRLASTPMRTVYSSSAYAPFAEQYATSGSADASFTGQEEDTAGSLYDFEFRRQSSSQGRWISPDPSGLAAVDPTNPQTWNRYAYAVNSPLALVDRLGLNAGCVGVGNNPDSTVLPICHPSGVGIQDCVWYSCSGQGAVVVDGVVQTIFDLSGLGSNSMATCPNNVCNGFTNSGEYFQFVAGAGGATGYIKFSDIIQGINEVNGTFMSDAQFQAYLAQTYAAQILAQSIRLSGSLPKGGAITYDPDNPNVDGGHANFDYTCADWSVCGPGRYDNGVHVECASGGLNCAEGSPLVAHDDTVSPWISPASFSFSTLFSGNFWEHGFVDLIYGQLCSCVFSH